MTPAWRLCLCLLSRFRISSRLTRLVGCCVFRCLILSLSSCLRPSHRPPPFHNASTFRCTPLVWLVFALLGTSTPPSCRNSARCRLLSNPPRSVGLSHCPSSAYCTDGFHVASRVTASCASTPLVRDSAQRCLPPLPPPYPSRMTSPSPEWERGLRCPCMRLSPVRGLPRHCRCRARPLPGCGD